MERRFGIVYKDIKEERMNDWLLSLQSENSGWKDYFKMRDLTILKNLGLGLEQKEYWLDVGKRLELLFLLAKSAESLKKHNEVKKEKDK